MAYIKLSYREHRGNLRNNQIITRLVRFLRNTEGKCAEKMQRSRKNTDLVCIYIGINRLFIRYSVDYVAYQQ